MERNDGTSHRSGVLIGKHTQGKGPTHDRRQIDNDDDVRDEIAGVERREVERLVYDESYSLACIYM